MATVGRVEIPDTLESEPKTDKNIIGYTGELEIPTYLAGEEPSDIRKTQYGAASETWLLGDLGRLGKTVVESLSPDTTWEEAQEEIEAKRLEELYDEYPEFETGKYEGDWNVIGGKTAALLLDPVYFLMPWGLALKSGTTLAKMSKLAAMGGGVGATDATVRSYSRTGEINPTHTALGAGIGAIAGPAGYGVQKLGGKLLNKVFPRLFKSKKQADAIDDILRGNLQKKYDLNATQLKNVEKISSLSSVQRLFADLQKAENTAAKFIIPKTAVVNKLKKLIGKNIDKVKTKSFTYQGETHIVKNTSKGSIQKIIDKIENQAAKSGEKYNSKIATAKHNHLVEVLRQLEKGNSLTTKVIRGLVSAATRPMLGAGGGAVYGTLFTESDEGFRAAVGAGFLFGSAHKLLMSGKISGISVPRQKVIAGEIKKSYFKQFTRFISVHTSHSLQSKLTSRGPILDEFSNTFFNRPTDTINRTFWGQIADDQSRLIASTTSVEGLTERAFNAWIGGIGEALGPKYSKLLDSAKLKIFQNQYLKVPRKLTVDEQNALQVQADALSVVRGYKGKVSDDAVNMSKGIKEYLNKFKQYYNEVGFKETELLDNYFPRKFNNSLIRNKDGAITDEFRKDIINIYKKLKANPKSKLTKSQRKQSAEKLADVYIEGISRPEANEILTLVEGRVVSSKGELPLSQHITEQRKLQGSWDDVESTLQKYLINDVRMVLSDITSNTVKSVEFARKFGTQAEVINGYLRRIYKQYQGNGFRDKDLQNGYFSNQHKGDVEAIKDSVNAYFGKYGRERPAWEKGITATLATLANWSMMDKVTIANLGDLIQPFQNSRFALSALRGIGQDASQQLNTFHTKAAKAMLQDVFVAADGNATPLLINGKSGSYLNLVGKSNEYFFKAIGLEGITNLARRYAYNVGAVDAHKTAQLFLKQLTKEIGPMRTNFQNLAQKGLNINTIKNKSLLKELNYLIRNGTAHVDADGNIVNLKEVIAFGRAKKLSQALENPSSAALIDRVGLQAMNRDAIIPTVGNRLLFTQTRNPWVRLLGQFSSWAMAKSAQTNAMISRIEAGDTRQLITMLSALTVYGGIKEVRDWARYGEWNITEEFQDDKPTWFAKAAELSGQHIPWMGTIALNRLLGYQKFRPTELAPVDTILADWGKAIQSGIGAITNENSYDKAWRDLYEVAPAPTIRKILSRLGLSFMTYKSDINFNINNQKVKKRKPKKSKFLFPEYAKGGAVEQARQLFSTGDVVTFNEEFSKARANKQELFEWEGNPKTTRLAMETDAEWKEFLGVEKIDKRVVLKTEPDEAPDEKAVAKLIAQGPKTSVIIPKLKPKKKIQSVENPIVHKAIGLSQDKDGKYHIAHPLFDRMLEKESSRGTNLVSPKGAVGLMQIMPNVHTKGKDVGFNVETKPTRKDLDDPAKNVAYAIEYYNGLKKYYGSDELALVAYNWGSGELDKWLAKGSNVKDLPQETKDYVNFVLDRKVFAEGGQVVRQKYGVGDAVTKFIINRALTQIKNTKDTYKKFNPILKDYNKTEKVLDFGSGLGHGTKELKGTIIKSHEPLTQHKKILNTKGKLPDYEDVNTLIQREGLNSQDAITNHMVLNVIEDPLERQLTVKTIGDLLKKDGIGIITTRDKIDAVTKKSYLDGFLVQKDGQLTFQKSFSKDELQKYIKNILGNTFEVSKIPPKYKVSGSGVIIKKVSSKKLELNLTKMEKKWFNEIDLTEIKEYAPSLVIKKGKILIDREDLEGLDKILNKWYIGEASISGEGASTIPPRIRNDKLIDKLYKQPLSVGGQVRQLLNGGGSTAREKYIMSKNKSNTGSSIGPAGMGGGSFKPDDKPEDYGTATHDAGGSSGNGKGIDTGIQVTTNLPIPIIDDEKTRRDKSIDILESREANIKAVKEGEIFGGSYEIGTEGYIGLTSTDPSSLEVDKGIRGEAQWTKGDTSIGGEYEDGDYSIMGRKELGSGWNVQGGVKNTGDNTEYGVIFTKKLRKGGLLDRKRS